MSEKDLLQRVRHAVRDVRLSASRVNKARTIAESAQQSADGLSARAGAHVELNADLFERSLSMDELTDEQKLQLLLPPWHRKRSSVMSTAQLREELVQLDVEGTRARDALAEHVERLRAADAVLAAMASRLHGHEAALSARAQAKASAIGEPVPLRSTRTDPMLARMHRDAARASGLAKAAMSASKAALDAAEARRTECGKARELMKSRNHERKLACNEERGMRSAAKRRAAEEERKDAREADPSSVAARDVMDKATRASFELAWRTKEEEDARMAEQIELGLAKPASPSPNIKFITPPSSARRPLSPSDLAARRAATRKEAASAERAPHTRAAAERASALEVEA